MLKNRFLHKLPILALLALTGACGVLDSDRTAEHAWWLEPLRPVAGATMASDGELTVSIGVVPGLDTDRITTLGPDASLNSYAGARWADHAPELLESLVVRSLQNAGIQAEVSAHRYTASDVCHLDLEARKFYSRLDGNESTRSVEVELAGYYSCEGSRKLISTSASVPVSGNHMPSIVAAYQRGFDDVMRALLEQI